MDSLGYFSWQSRTNTYKSKMLHLHVAFQLSHRMHNYITFRKYIFPLKPYSCRPSLHAHKMIQDCMWANLVSTIKTIAKCVNVLTMALIILAIWYDTAIEWRPIIAHSAQILYVSAHPSVYLIKPCTAMYQTYVHYIDATTTGAKLQSGAILSLIERLGEENTIVAYWNGWNMLVI